MAKRHWYTRLSGACKVPRSLLGWWLEITPSDFLGRHAIDPGRYCSDCAKAARLALAAESAPKPDARSDSDRYAELRKLVEAWQSHTTGSSQTLADWRHR